MSRIIAMGVYQGQELQLEVNDKLILTSNGEPDAYIQEWLNELIQTPKNLAGCYEPEPNSMFAVLSVLKRDIFDNIPHIEIEGDIGVMPHEEGIVY